MSVAAYASLVSLTHVLDNVHYRAQLHRLHIDIKQIEALQECVNFLLEFVEVHSERTGKRIEDLWRQISEVAFDAEEVFDSHVVSQLQLGDEGDASDLAFPAFNEDIEGLIQKIDFIKNELFSAEEGLEGLRIGEQPRVPEFIGSLLATSSGSKNRIVGFDGHMIEIMDELTRDESNLQILPIVGMGGIGKTTLAKKVFDDPYIVEHFDLRIWLTISQEYSVHEILIGLLNDGIVKEQGGNLDGLGHALYQKLFGRRYLIVMDDVWTEQAWNDLRMFFPNNLNRSRVIMTTRLENVAGSLSSRNPYSMTFLDEDTSWNLFCQTIFGQEDCPYPELEEIGREIAKGCKGLPLEIIVIGGILANSDMSKEYWELVAKNVSSFGKSCDGEHCLKILRLSYSHLPIYLKPCFLHMRTFHEDAEIDVSELIKIWVDEGFIKKKGDKSLEEIANEYMNDLVGRNLIFFSSRRWLFNEVIKTCGIHDLLRDLCFSEADKQHFMRSPKVQLIDKSAMGKVCFLCNKGKDTTHLQALVLVSSSTLQDNIPLVCGACKMTYSHLNGLRLVKVVDDNDVGFDSFVQHTKLRQVSITFFVYSKVVSLSMVNLLWNLQTLVIPNIISTIVLPFELWEMPQLRCVKVTNIDLLDPPVAHIEGRDFFILKNLHTLSLIRNFKCTDEVLYRIRNLKELEIIYDLDMEWTNASRCNLDQLEKLESLCLQHALVENFTFPNSLKMLELMECRFSWIRMSIIGSLPNLEVLKLFNAAEGSEWNPIEGEFLRLKRLSIKHANLVKWTAEQVHFPNLEWLVLEHIPHLEEIPLSIGDIPALHTIELVGCSTSVITSARKIWEDQQSMDNETLKILVDWKLVNSCH